MYITTEVELNNTFITMLIQNKYIFIGIFCKNQENWILHMLDYMNYLDILYLVII